MIGLPNRIDNRRRPGARATIALAGLLASVLGCARKSREVAADGGVSVGTGFTCGSRQCSALEYCVVFARDPSGSEGDTSCKPLPPACAPTPTCACLGRSGDDPTVVCTDADGHATITLLPAGSVRRGASPAADAAQDAAAALRAAAASSRPCSSIADCLAPDSRQRAVRSQEPGKPMRNDFFCRDGYCTAPSSTVEREAVCDALRPDDPKRGLPDWDRRMFVECVDDAAASAVLDLLSNKVRYAEALAVCDRHLGDGSGPCKLQLCDNLGLARDNMRERDPEVLACRAEASKGWSCSDGKQNGLETDIDCGGPNCAACKTTSKCQSHTDCKSKFCGVSGVEHHGECLPLCSDGLISAHEPCGCFEGVTPEGKVNGGPTAMAWVVGAVAAFEQTRTAGGRRAFCCGGKEYYLASGKSCSRR